MNTDLLYALMLCETDIDGVMRRFSGDEALYMTCLNGFLDDPTMDELNAAIENGAWDEAFTAAHALKGLAGNMGFVPLFHASAELVILIRAGRTGEVDASFAEVKRCYGQITSTICQCCDTDTKGECK